MLYPVHLDFKRLESFASHRQRIVALTTAALNPHHCSTEEHRGSQDPVLGCEADEEAE